MMESIQTEISQQNSNYLDRAFADRVISWTLKLERKGSIQPGFIFSDIATNPTLISTSLAILIFELFGYLPEVKNENWAEILVNSQDPKSGMFIDRLLAQGDFIEGLKGENYTKHHTTYFVLNALDALGVVPKFPLNFIEPYYDLGYFLDWLENLDWSNPWKSSNWVMFIAQALICDSSSKHSIDEMKQIHFLLDWLDEHQDNFSGFWGKSDDIQPENAMAASYHFLPIYLYVGRKFSHIEAIIDNTLFLQADDGLFHANGGGDTCLDVDALDILIKCSLLTDYRAKDIEFTVGKIFEGLISNLEGAGGFCRAKLRPFPKKSRKRRVAEFFRLDTLLDRPYQPVMEFGYYSRWKLLPFDIRKGDLWSTWFRGFGLGLICSRYPINFPTEINWKFRDLPALGWHDLSKLEDKGGYQLYQ